METPEQLDFLALEIETERLKLVPISMHWQMDSFREFNKDVTTYMHHAPPKTPAVVEQVIKTAIEEMRNGTDAQMVILKKDTGEFLGRAGLHKVDTKNPELGVWLKKSAHGQGYGREAVTALKQWADINLDYEYIVYPVDRDNLPSRKIPEALGGTVGRIYDEKNESGDMLHLLEYRIYPPKHSR